MRALLCAAMILACAGQAAAQGKVTAAEAHVLSAFATGADPLVVAENVKAGPVLRAQLGVETDSRGIYEWVAARTSGTRVRVTLLTPAEAVSHASLGVNVAEPLMRVEAGDAAFLVQYASAQKNVVFVEQLSAPTAGAAVLKPAAPLAALPPPPPPVAARAVPPVKPAPPRTGPRGNCVVKPVMSEDDLWNCSETVVPAAVPAPPALPVAEQAPEPPAPAAPPPVTAAAVTAAAVTVAPAASAPPPLQSTGECLIKPVMSEQDLRNCAAVSTQTSTPMLEAPAAPAATLAATAPQAASKPPSRECIIKPVMSDEELRNCATASAQRSTPILETAAPVAAAAAPARMAAPPSPSRECIIKPVMSDEDLRNCANAKVSAPRGIAAAETPPPAAAAPQLRSASVPSAPRECVIKPVMSDDDLRACGIRR